MIQLEKERFEAWLFSQPDERQFNYWDCPRCMGASFVRETTNIRPSFGGKTWREEHKSEYYDIPAWLRDFLAEGSQLAKGLFTAGQMKLAWTRLHGQPQPGPVPLPVQFEAEPQPKE